LPDQISPYYASLGGGELRKHPTLIITLCFLIVYVTISADSCIYAEAMRSDQHAYPDTYRNPRFWDEEIGYCFIRQETLNSCGPASVQMVLKYLNVITLPTQSELAIEMNTSIYNYTYRIYMHIPFVRRGFEEYLSAFLSKDFKSALGNLKGNVSEGFPVIILTWYDTTHKTGHYRVVTGYNSSGIFVHDPAIGPNVFFNNTILEDLWYYSRFWALIIFKQPHFDLIVKIRDLLGFPVSDVKVTIADGKEMMSTTNQNGTVAFSELPLGTYRLGYQYKFGSGEDIITLTKTTVIEYEVILSDLTVGILLFVIFILALFYLLLRASGRVPFCSSHARKKWFT